tara:strand:+ start:1118 stop:1657 length:540 start_codon:yes stop_codon:yes gene_type:complete
MNTKIFINVLQFFYYAFSCNVFKLTYGTDLVDKSNIGNTNLDECTLHIYGFHILFRDIKAELYFHGFRWMLTENGLRVVHFKEGALFFKAAAFTDISALQQECQQKQISLYGVDEDRHVPYGLKNMEDFKYLATDKELKGTPNGVPINLYHRDTLLKCLEEAGIKVRMVESKSVLKFKS